MDTPCWQPLGTTTTGAYTVKIKAKPEGLWTVAYEHVSGPRKLKLVAEGQWNYTDKTATECSPDGDLASPVAAAACLNPNAPPGALIGKVGGSTAGKADGLVLVVGRFCVLQLDDKVKGPLYLTINDDPAGFEHNTGEISVSIFEAP